MDKLKIIIRLINNETDSIFKTLYNMIRFDKYSWKARLKYWKEYINQETKEPLNESINFYKEELREVDNGDSLDFIVYQDRIKEKIIK